MSDYVGISYRERFVEMDKRLVLNIDPTPENGRNSEGSFLRAPNGDILFAYSRYRTSASGDDSPCDIALRRSSDEGDTWSEPTIIAKSTFFGVSNVMSVSGLMLKDGRLCFFMLIKENDGSSTIGRAVSSDGFSFEVSRCACNYLRNYYVINNDRFVRLADGRIAAPAAKHDVGLDVIDRNMKYGFDPAIAVVLISSDDGESFSCMSPRVSLTIRQNGGTGMQEPGIIEYPGYHRMWARTSAGYQYECYSFDGMKTFSQPEPSQFTSPCSPLGMWRLSDGTVYAVYNPIPRYNGRNHPEWYSDRTPLVIRKSSDGVNFGPLNYIEEDPARGYCYPAIFETKDGCLLCAYCRGNADDRGCLNRLGIMKITKSTIE